MQHSMEMLTELRRHPSRLKPFTLTCDGSRLPQTARCSMGPGLAAAKQELRHAACNSQQQEANMHNCKQTLQSRQTERDDQRWARDGYHQEEHSCPWQSGRQRAPHVPFPTCPRQPSQSRLRAPQPPLNPCPGQLSAWTWQGTQGAAHLCRQNCRLPPEKVLCRPCDHSFLQAKLALPSPSQYLLLQCKCMC